MQKKLFCSGKIRFFLNYSKSGPRFRIHQIEKSKPDPHICHVSSSCASIFLWCSAPLPIFVYPSFSLLLLSTCGGTVLPLVSTTVTVRTTDLLDDVHGGCPGSAHIHQDWLDKGGAGKVLDLLGHGGGEEEGLPLPREVGEDGPHVLLETHVNHPVSLVHHQVSADKNMKLLATMVLGKHKHS